MSVHIAIGSQAFPTRTRRARPFLRVSLVWVFAILCAVALIVALACEKQPAQPAEKEPAAKTLAEKALAQKSAADLASLFPSSLPKLLAAAPEDAILVVGVQDMDRPEEWKMTAAGESWNDPNLAIWREQNWPKVKRTFQDKVGLNLDELTRVMNGDMVLFFAVKPSATTGDKPGVSFACLWRPEKDVAAAETFLQKNLVARSSRVIVQREGDLLAIGFQGASDGLAEAVSRYKTMSLSSVAAGSVCDRILRVANPKAFVHVWGDMGKAFALASKAIEESFPPSQPGQPATGPANTIHALGLDTLDYAYMETTFREKGLLFSSRLQCKGNRQGAMALVGRNGPMKSLNLFPATADNAAIVRIAPVKEILALIRTVLGSLGKESEMATAQWDMALGEAETFLGLQDFETEFPALFGQEMGFAMSVGGVGMGGSATLMVELGDKEKFMTCLRKAVQSTGIAPTPATYEGVSYEFLMISNLPLPFQFTYGVVGDFFVFSTFQNGFRDAVVAHKTGVNLPSSEEFKKAMGRLDRPEGFAASYAKVSPAVSGMVPMATSLLIPRINQELGTDFTPADIPNIQVFLDHQQPTVSVTWAEDNALAAQSYSTGVVGLDMSSLAPIAAVSAAVAIPNFLEAQARSKVSRAKSDMRSMATGLEAYFVDNNVYPLSTDAPAAALQGSARVGLPALTTPISYISPMSGILNDPFGATEDTKYRYYCPDGKGWILISPGPDKDYDFDPKSYDPAAAQPSEVLLQSAFDATNGTTSSGDIFRFKE